MNYIFSNTVMGDTPSSLLYSTVGRKSKFPHTKGGDYTELGDRN